MNAVFWFSYAFLWILLAIQGFAFLEIVRQLGQIREQLGLHDGPMELFGTVKIGERLPDTSAIWADGRPVDWSENSVAESAVLVFLHPGCMTCHTVANSFPAPDGSDGPRLIAIVEGRTADDARTFMEEHKMPSSMVILDAEASLARELKINSKPAAVTVRHGLLWKAVAINSPSQLGSVLKEAHNPVGQEVGAAGSTTFVESGTVRTEEKVNGQCA